MKLSLRRAKLPLREPFTISRGTRSFQDSVYVCLEHDGLVGLGEVSENHFYGQTFDSISQSLKKTLTALNGYIDNPPQEVWSTMAKLVEGDLFALSALDTAAFDLQGKRQGVATWKRFNLEWNRHVRSSYTIGIDSIDVMRKKLTDNANWEIFKIKLGTENDIEIVSALRQCTDGLLRVDANCAWNVDQAISNSIALSSLGVEFIEQPLPTNASRKDKNRLYNESALPIIADEDCQKESDVVNCVGSYHGINIKVNKCGGLTPAIRMLGDAKRLGLKTMVGCMVESSIGISGAAQLVPLLDYADLDGAALLKDEPACGIQIENGTIILTDAPGNGCSIDFERLANFSSAKNKSVQSTDAHDFKTQWP